jgi:hypothetical protein
MHGKTKLKFKEVLNVCFEVLGHGAEREAGTVIDK